MTTDSTPPKKGPPPVDDGDGFPWALFASIVGLIVVLVLRRFLRMFFPLLFALLVLVPILWYLYRQHRFRGVQEAAREYEELVALLTNRGLRSYRRIADQSFGHLLAARDRAEHLESFLHREDPEAVRARLRDLEKQLKHPGDEENRNRLERSAASAREALANLERLQEFLKRFSEGKTQLAEFFRNTRLKLELGDIEASLPQNREQDEIGHLFTEIETMDFLYESVDRPSSRREKESS
jgi:cbb3-type cytochrome oxidase subunit 3